MIFSKVLGNVVVFGKKIKTKKQIKILAEVNHPNIVRYKEHYEEANMLWIVMEYADGGDLGQRLKEQRKKQTGICHTNHPKASILNFFTTLQKISHPHFSFGTLSRAASVFQTNFPPTSEAFTLTFPPAMLIRNQQNKTQPNTERSLYWHTHMLGD